MKARRANTPAHEGGLVYANRHLQRGTLKSFKVEAYRHQTISRDPCWDRPPAKMRGWHTGSPLEQLPYAWALSGRADQKNFQLSLNVHELALAIPCLIAILFNRHQEP